MRHDSDHAPRFSKKNRRFEAFQVSNVERLEASGEASVRGQLAGRDVELRYLETSGEFYLHAEEGDDTTEISRSDLRDIGPALARFQQNVPWVDAVTGHVIKAVHDAIFPTTLADFEPRSASDLGPVMLVAGRTPREEIDVLLDTRTAELSLIVISAGRKAARRPLTTQEAWDLTVSLRARVEGQRVTAARSVLAVVIEAAQRQAHH